MLRFEGQLLKDGKFWLAEIPMLGAMTQGRTKKQAYTMIADLIETMVNRDNFAARVYPGKKCALEVGSDNVEALVALLLQRQRQMAGLTLADAAARLSQSSRNAYARYEQGKASPTLEKLTELMAAVDPDHDLVLSQNHH
jgi:hypothetical protein